MDIHITFEDGREKIITFAGRVKMRHLRQLADAGRDLTRQMPVIADVLGLTPDEADELTFDQFVDIMAAINEALADKLRSVAVPNASAPLSE